MSATEDDAEGQDEDMPDASQPNAPPEEAQQEESMIREAAIGKGTALSLSTWMGTSAIVYLLALPLGPSLHCCKLWPMSTRVPV